MKANVISTECFNFQKVFECNIDKKVNQHAKAVVRGITEDTEEDIMRKITEVKFEKIYAEDMSGQKEILFEGIVYNFVIEVVGGVKELTLQLISATYLADQKEKIRSYQEVNATFKDIIEEKLLQYKCIGTWQKEVEREVGELVVQYKETDWEFIKRLVSHVELCVIPKCGMGENGVSIGVPSTLIKKLSDVSDYAVRVFDDTIKAIEIESREIIELGQGVEFLDYILYVYSIDGYYKGEEYVARYQLREKVGFECKKYRNPKIVGASLAGAVVDIKQDKVKIELEVDKVFPHESEIWFPYASVYSSPDGTGWYCMPEMGDSVRLYFPSEKERDAYVINAVHVSESEEAMQMRNDPNNKILMNRYRKMIKFSANEILITNNNGMTIRINDETGIHIESNKDITITADQMLSIMSKSDKVEVISPTEIELNQGSTVIDIKENIVMEAGRLNIQQ